MASFFNMKGTTQNEFQVGIKGPIISRDITNSILTLPNSRIEKLFLGSSYNSAKYIDATDYTGNAATATKLKAAKTISLTGLVSGSGNFDGSSNLTITTSNLNLNGANIDWTGVTVPFANLPTGTGSNQVAIGNHNHDSRYLKLSGGTMTGGITLQGLSSSAYNATGLIFTGGSRIGENGSKELGIYAGGESIYFRTSSASSLSSYGMKLSDSDLSPTSNKGLDLGTTSLLWNNVYAANLRGTAIYENGTSLASKYLGISAKAADTDKLDNQDSAYYLNYNNFTNTPTLGDAASKTVATSIDATTDGTKLPNVGAVRDYITSTVSGVYQFKGTVASVTTDNDGKITPPTGTVAGNGFVYNVTSQFTYMGETYPAGTNIVCEQETSGSTTTTLWKPLGGSFEVDLTQFQPKDGDLTAIAGLSGTSGFLKKTAANTWTLDTAPQSSSVAHSLKFSTDGSGDSASDATFDGSAEKKISYNTVGAASSGHTHGNLTNDGKLQTNGVEIAANDQLVITDNSDSSKVAKASIAFDASTATKYLSKKGTWEDVGVQSIATGTSNGTISVKTNGTTANVSVYGLGDRAFDSTTYLPLAGGTVTGNIGILTDNTDKFIRWRYVNNANWASDTNSWQIGMLGTGSDDANYFVIQSTGVNNSSTEFKTALRFGQTTLDAGFAGNIYPIVTSTKSLGTSSLKWSNVWATKVNDYTLAAACAKAVDTTLTSSSTNLPTSQAVATYVSTNYSPKAGSTSITTVGTITSGTWNGATIDIAHGGTGATTASGARTNLGLGAAATCGTTTSIADGTDGNLLPNVTAVKGYVAAISSGAVEYLGLADDASDLILTCGKGDYYRASAAFEISAGSTVTSKITIHAGDLIVALQDNPVNRTADYWFAVHTESDNDTKNTAGSTNSTGKLFLIGATSQGANPTTYSNSNVYAENGNLHATKFNTYTLADACEKAVDTTLTSSGTNLPTSQAVATYISGELANYSLTSHNHDATYVNVSGDTMTGDLILKNTTAANDSPAVIFQRGTSGDSYTDWKMWATGGNLCFAQRAAGDTWTTRMTLKETSQNSGKLYIDSTAVSMENHNHDATYVNVSGDTMTGSLTLTRQTDRQLQNDTTIGTMRGDIHINTRNYGSGSGILNGNLAAITFGTDDAGGGNAQAGIYTVTGGGYGTKMLFATSSSYATGATTKMIINHNGYVGIGTTNPTTLLSVNGGISANGDIKQNGTKVSLEGHTHPYAGSSSAGGAANSVANSITFNSSGTGAASGTTFDGSVARTISYNTIGAASVNDVNDSKTKVGNTQSTSKLYLIGVTSTGSTNGANATSYYSNTNFSVTNGVMNVGNEVKSNKVSVGTVSSGEVTTKASMQYNSTDDCIEFVFA